MQPLIKIGILLHKAECWPNKGTSLTQRELGRYWLNNRVKPGQGDEPASRREAVWTRGKESELRLKNERRRRGKWWRMRHRGCVTIGREGEVVECVCVCVNARPISVWCSAGHDNAAGSCSHLKDSSHSWGCYLQQQLAWLITMLLYTVRAWSWTQACMLMLLTVD